MIYLSGAVSLLFGIMVMWNPVAGAASVLWMIAFFAVLYGIALIALSFRLEGIAGKAHSDRRPAPRGRRSRAGGELRRALRPDHAGHNRDVLHHLTRGARWWVCQE